MALRKYLSKIPGLGGLAKPKTPPGHVPTSIRQRARAIKAKTAAREQAAQQRAQAESFRAKRKEQLEQHQRPQNSQLDHPGYGLGGKDHECVMAQLANGHVPEGWTKVEGAYYFANDGDLSDWGQEAYDAQMQAGTM